MKIILQHSLTRKHIQRHKVKHSNRNNSAANCSFHSNLVHRTITSQAIHYRIKNRCLKSKAKGQGHNVT